MMEPISPSVWRRARRNTARRVSAVRIASGEYQGCPPGVVRGAARHPSMASSENHTVKLPRWRKLASYLRQFITLRFWGLPHVWGLELIGDNLRHYWRGSESAVFGLHRRA